MLERIKVSTNEKEKKKFNFLSKLIFSFFPHKRQCGVEEILNKEYAGNVVAPESKYDFTIQVDCDKVSGDKAAAARKFALLKRHALAAPFYKVFNDVEQKKAGSN